MERPSTDRFEQRPSRSLLRAKPVKQLKPLLPQLHSC
jgi:hypothetical protein